MHPFEEKKKKSTFLCIILGGFLTSPSPKPIHGPSSLHATHKKSFAKCFLTRHHGTWWEDQEP